MVEELRSVGTIPLEGEIFFKRNENIRKGAHPLPTISFIHELSLIDHLVTVQAKLLFPTYFVST